MVDKSRRVCQLRIALMSTTGAAAASADLMKLMSPWGANCFLLLRTLTTFAVFTIGWMVAKSLSASIISSTAGQNSSNKLYSSWHGVHQCIASLVVGQPCVQPMSSHVLLGRSIYRGGKIKFILLEKVSPLVLCFLSSLLLISGTPSKSDQ